MRRRTLGKTGYSISEVGLGTWAIGGSWGAAVDERDALDALSYAHDQGVNFFDTADVYGNGRSERLLGKLFDKNRDVYVATKFGRQGDHQDPKNYTYDRVKHCLTDSLQRLRRETVDLYQIHCPPADIIRQGDVFGALQRLKDEGLVRHYGVSVETVDEGLDALRDPGVASLQIIFNVFRHKPLERLIPNAQAQNVGILARVPLASGLLSGKFTAEDQFDPDDHRHFNREGEAFNVGETFAGLPFDKGVELVEHVRWIAQGRRSLASAALRWILDQPGVTSVIPGFKTQSQIDANLASSEIPSFSEDERRRLEDFYHTSVLPWIRGPY